MNQRPNTQPNEIRELSLDELDTVSGGAGNMFDFGLIRVMWWKDGGFDIGLKGIGSVSYDPEFGMNVGRNA
jgi:hypothetical protein